MEQRWLTLLEHTFIGKHHRTDIDYNNANCAGQNGYSNAAAVQGGTPYSGGVLTTTGGAVGTGISTTAAVTTTSSSSVVQIP